MKLKSQLITNTAGLIAAKTISTWMSRLAYKIRYYDPTVDPVHPEYRGQKIYIFWHEYILFPIYLRGHCNLAMLISKHSDAEILSRAALHLGFSCVRGSTRRGGAAALRELLRKSRDMNLTITPDGPRGPRRRMAPGPIFLAAKLQMPLVLIGFGFDRPWRMKSWDRFAIPRPGTRARAVVSPEICLPADLDRAGLEHYRLRMEGLLNWLTAQAEHWAETGEQLAGASFLRKQHPRHVPELFDAPEILPWPEEAEVPMRDCAALDRAIAI